LPKACWILRIFFRLGIPKFLAKLDAVSLLQAVILSEMRMRQTCDTELRYLATPLIRQCCEAAKNHACEWKFLLPLHSFPTLLPLLTAGKNIVGYFLGRPCTIKFQYLKSVDNHGLC
jgi:hypothetical protein